MMLAITALLTETPVSLVMTTRVGLPHMAQSICAAPGSKSDFYVVTGGTGTAALVRVNTSSGTANVIRTTPTSKDGPFWLAREPGLIQVVEREGDNSIYSFIDAASGKVVY